MPTLNTNPSWLKKRLVNSSQPFRTREILSSLGVDTVCERAHCPNLNECFSKSQATFLILGDSCTRRCAFCSVEKNGPRSIDDAEPYRIKEAASRLNLTYIVVTSVTRDDLEDGGAAQFAKTICAVRELGAGISIEVLVPDFRGRADSIKEVLAAGPDIFSHNIETVRSLYPSVRQGADYNRSLDILRGAKSISKGQLTKSSIMLGLGEDEGEVLETIRDIQSTGCDILTIGQYLRPSEVNVPVRRYISPEEFERYRQFGTEAGFKFVASSPFVRSSYKAGEIYNIISNVEASNDRG